VPNTRLVAKDRLREVTTEETCITGSTCVRDGCHACHFQLVAFCCVRRPDCPGGHCSQAGGAARHIGGTLEADIGGDGDIGSEGYKRFLNQSKCMEKKENYQGV
jgi:hypothetical protein